MYCLSACLYFFSLGSYIPAGALDKELSTLNVAGLSILGIGLSLFFVCSFACLFYCQRNRIGHYNFNVKPKEEKFTYLVFNT